MEIPETKVTDWVPVEILAFLIHRADELLQIFLWEITR